MLETVMPVSPNPETMTAEIVAASSAPLGDGYSLAIAPDLSNIEALDRPLPVLVDHAAAVENVIGYAAGFRHERSPDGLDLLLAQVQLQPDHPEAPRVFDLIRSGALRWSIRFEPLETHPAPSGDVIVVDRWRALEISAVPVAADPAAVTRSGADIRAAVTRAGLPASFADDLIRSGASVDAARAAILDRLADMEPPTVSHLSVLTRDRDSLADAVTRSWNRQSDQPLWLELRSLGHRGRNATEVLRAALSTSDLPQALTAVGNRQLLAQFQQAPQGVRVAAAVRQLADYRQAATLDVGLVGAAQKLNEGAEIRFGAADEQAATYKPSRYGLGLSFTAESMANDDLAGLERAIAELGAAMLEAEAKALAELLEGNALGALAPDGKRLFHADHQNTVAGPLSIQSLGDAVAKLRGQTSVGGRFTYQAPGAIVCAPSNELIVRQLLSDLIAPVEPAALNPWRGLDIAVDPQLSGSFVYLIAAGDRRPLELGRVTPAPQIESRVEFTTSAYQTKAEHSFGVAVVDHRPIVRLTVAA